MALKRTECQGFRAWPAVIGHRSRAAMLERLVVCMKSKPGVWFATHEQIARHVWQAAASKETGDPSKSP